MRGKIAGIAIIRVGLLRLPDISPSSGAFRATFPPRGRLYRAVGAAYMPPVAAAPDITIYRVNGTERSRPFPTNLPEICISRLLSTSRLFVGRGLDPSLPPCVYRQFPRRGGVTPPYGATKKHRAVYIIMNISGWFVGAAYMPPVAANPANRPNGKTARDAYMRPLQTCRKWVLCL